MNYYEHRLREINNEINLLSGRDDTKELIKSLKAERNKILKEIRGLI